MRKLSFTAAALVLGALGLAFVVVTSDFANAREMTPTELLSSCLAKPKTLGTATKPEVLDAICCSIHKVPRDAAQIVKAAVAARKDFSADIVGKAMTCSGPLNSALVADIVNAGITANPQASAAITERAIMIAPDFRTPIQQAGSGGETGNGSGAAAVGEGGFTNPPSNQNAPPGSFAGGGGGFNPQQGKCTVCHNDKNPHEISIPCSQVPKYLADHPGDYEGSCQATPVANR